MWFPLPSGTASQPLSITQQTGVGPIRLFKNGTFVQNVNGVTSVTNPPRYDWVPLNSNPSRLYFKQGADGYVWDGAAATAIADAVYTGIQATLAPGAAYLNGHIFVVTSDNKVYNNANADDATNWTPASFIVANNTPGYALGIIRHLQYVLVFKGASTEIFYDAGASPRDRRWRRVDGVRIAYGTTTFNSVVSYEDRLYWVSQGQGGDQDGVDFQVVMMVGLEPKVISTPEVERLLNSTSYGTMVLIPGHRFYAIWDNLSTTSLWYDIDQNVWSEIVTSSTIRAMSGDTPIYQDSLGYETQFLISEYQDTVNGVKVPIQVDIVTPLQDFSIDREKFLGAMYFSGDQIAGSILQIRRTDDDYQTWSNFRTVDLSSKRPRITDEGSFYRRAYNLRHTGNTPFREKALGLQLDIGVL